MLTTKSVAKAKAAAKPLANPSAVEVSPNNPLMCAEPAAMYAARDSRANSEHAKFSGLLAQQNLSSDFDIAKLVHNRLSLTVIDRLLAEGITKQEINLIAPQRTLAHRRAKSEPLTIDESDRAVRLARVIAQAESVLADQAKAMAWLRRPMKRFEGMSPLDMLVSDVGSRLVEEALVQIDEGFFA